MKRITNPSRLYPDFVATSVLDIDADSLLALGITHLIFDLDRTLVPRRTDMLPPSYRTHIRALQAAGLTIVIGTNSRRNTAALAKLLQVTVVRPHRLSMKPRRSFYARLVALAGTAPEHIAMAGDHIINDVIGPNRAGFTSILVTALTRHPTLIQQRYIHFVQRARSISSRPQ